MRPGRKCVEIELTLTEMYTRKAVYYTPPQTICVQTWHITYINNNVITTHDEIPTEEEGFCLFVLKVLH